MPEEYKVCFYLKNDIISLEIEFPKDIDVDCTSNTLTDFLVAINSGSLAMDVAKYLMILSKDKAIVGFNKDVILQTIDKIRTVSKAAGGFIVRPSEVFREID
jgi:predicted nucleotide-binding protein (sugar kinase/HSP70/actin superfamily)